MSEVVGPNPLKVGCGKADTFNLKDFDHQTHSHLVFENVNESEFIMNFQQILMGQPNPVGLGQSGTRIYEYKVLLARKPVIVTMDEDAV